MSCCVDFLFSVGVLLSVIGLDEIITNDQQSVTAHFDVSKLKTVVFLFTTDNLQNSRFRGDLRFHVSRWLFFFQILLLFVRSLKLDFRFLLAVAVLQLGGNFFFRLLLVGSVVAKQQNFHFQYFRVKRFCFDFFLV